MNNKSRLESVRSFLTYALQFGVAAVFIRVALGQVAGERSVSSVFDNFAAGSWMRYLVAGLQLVGAIALLTRSVSAYAAALLSLLMLLAGILATGEYSTSPWFWSSAYTGRVPLAPNLLLLACMVIAWVRRDQFARFSGAPENGNQRAKLRSPTTAADRASSAETGLDRPISS